MGSVQALDKMVLERAKPEAEQRCYVISGKVRCLLRQEWL